MKAIPFHLITLILAGIVLIGCQHRPGKPFRPAKINHIVFFGLQSPGDKEELIQDCDTKLATIDGVASYWCGEHGDFGRTTVDGNYDVSFYVGFNSDKDYENYIKDPKHIEVVQKWKPRWEWIRIHDVVDADWH